MRMGASLALQAPIDQLFTATELNEWALCATLHERDPVRWANVTDALLADYLADADDPAQIIPPVLEETAALSRLDQRAARERRPDIIALIAAAAARGVTPLLDEASLTLGTGRGSQTWPLDALPQPDSVPWSIVEQDSHRCGHGLERQDDDRAAGGCLRPRAWLARRLQLHGRRVHRPRAGRHRAITRVRPARAWCCAIAASRPPSSRRHAAASCVADSRPITPKSRSSPT